MANDYIQRLTAGEPFFRGSYSFPRDAILHYLRRGVENHYRWRLHHLDTHPHCVYTPELNRSGGSSHQQLPERLYAENKSIAMEPETAMDFCNKTAPLYVTTEETGAIRTHWCLQHWLFKQWFVPYRSEIDFGQFIVKFISGRGCLPQNLAECVDRIVELNKRACAEAEEMIDQIRDLIFPEERDLWVIKPTFRAVALVALGTDYPLFERYIPYTPVLVVQTGEEEGLSAPISLSTINGPENVEEVVGSDGKTRQAVHTTLRGAYEFLRALEEREIAAFGHQPDPRGRGVPKGFLNCPTGALGCCSTFEQLREDVETEARRLGWEGEFDVETPTSGWVDVQRYPASLAGGKAKAIGISDDNYRYATVRRVSERYFIVKHYESMQDDASAC